MQAIFRELETAQTLSRPLDSLHRKTPPALSGRYDDMARKVKKSAT
jgi:hypothetical protein